MKLRVFTLRADASGVLDDRAVAEFLADKDVLDLSDHFLVHERTPTLVLVVSYRDADRAGGRGEPRKDWRADLDAAARRLYDELRTWRGRRARRDGLPPYLILNNREMAEVASRRPGSLAALREIPGVGEAKAGRWGEEVLALITGVGTAAADEVAGGQEGSG